VIEPSVIEEQEGIFPGAAVWPKLNDTEPKLVGNYQAPVKEIERITAKSVTEPMPGVYIYDLQQEIAGVPVLKFHEKRGTRVVIRYGEMLYPPLERYGELAGCMLQANLREASNTDIYICSGEEEEIYQIFGSMEADVSNNIISNESPVGQALLGHSVGDEISVEVPGGIAHFTILEISKADEH